MNQSELGHLIICFLLLYESIRIRIIFFFKLLLLVKILLTRLQGERRVLSPLYRRDIDQLHSRRRTLLSLKVFSEVEENLWIVDSWWLTCLTFSSVPWRIFNYPADNAKFVVETILCVCP